MTHGQRCPTYSGFEGIIDVGTSGIMSGQPEEAKKIEDG